MPRFIPIVIQVQEGQATATVQQLGNAFKELDKDATQAGSAGLPTAAHGMTSAFVAAELLTGVLRHTFDLIKSAVIDTTLFAGRTEELTIALHQLARANGIEVDEIDQQLRGLIGLNIARQEATQILSQMIGANLDLSKATQLARVAQDTAVISGKNSSEAFVDLTNAILLGNTEAFRSAGIFLSVEDALKKGAKALNLNREALTEQQRTQILTNAVIEYGTRVTGTYEAAMGSASKQMRSLVRIHDDAKEAVGNLFQGPFAFGVKITGELLKLIAQYPERFAAITVSVLALTASLVFYNTQLIPSMIAGGAGLIAMFKNLVFWTINWQVALTDAQVATSVLSGWAAVAIAVGIIVVSLTKQADAAEAANKITIEQIQSQAKAYDSSKALAQAASDVATAQADSTEQHQKLNAVLAQLDPTTQVYINALRDLKDKIAAVNEESRKTAEQNKGQLEASLITSTQGIVAQTQSLKENREQQAQANENIRQFRQAIVEGRDVFGSYATQIQLSSGNVVRLSTEETNLNKALTENEAKFLQSAHALGLNEEQLAGFLKTAGYTAPQIKQLTDLYTALTPKVDETTKALNAQARSLKEVKADLDNLTKGTEAQQTQVESKILEIVKNAKNAAEARRLAQQALKGDQGFRDIIEQRKAATAAEKAVREIFDPTTKTGRDRGDALKITTDEVRKLRSEVEALQRSGGKLFALQIEKSDLQKTKGDLENILKLRHELAIPLTLPLPRGLEGIRQETRILTEQKKIVEEVTKAKDAQSEADFGLAQLILTQNIPLVDAETRAQTKYLTSIRERRNAELELTADLRSALLQRRDALRDEQSSLRDTHQQYVQLQLDAVKAAESARLASIKSQLQFEIAFGQEPEIQHKLQVQLNSQTEQLKPPLVSIKDNVANIVKQLESILGAISGKSGGTTAAGIDSLKELTSFIKQQGFQVTSTTGGRHNVGSAHYEGRAADVRTRGKSAAEIEDFIATAKAAGLDVVDERRRLAGEKVYGGPHFHLQLLPQSGRHPAAPQAPVSPPPPIPEVIDETIRTAANYAAVNVADEQQYTKLTIAVNRQRDSVTQLKGAEQDLKNAQAADLAVREELFKTTGKTLEQHSIEAALAKRDEQRIDEDLKAATDAGVVRHDLALARGRDEQYVSRITIEAERARAAAEKSTVDSIIVNEELLAKLRAGNAKEWTRLSQDAADARLKSEISVYQQIATLEDQIAHAGEDSAARRVLADLQATKSSQDSMEKLADATVVHSEQVRATVLGHLAQQRSITEAWGDGIISVYDSITGVIDKGIDRLTHGLGIVDNLLKSIAHQLANRLFQKLLDALFPPSGGGNQVQAAGAGGTGGGGGSIFNLLGSIFRPSGGGGGASYATGGFAGGTGAAQLLGGGGLAGLLGGITPPVSLTSTLASQAAVTGAIQSSGAAGLGAAGFGGAGAGLSGGVGITGLLGGLAPLLPLFGLTAGAGLGGQSRFGSLLGGAGGLIGGLGLAAALSPGFALSAGSFIGGIPGLAGVGGFLSTAGPLALAGVAGLIAAPLIIGAIILSKNAARRRDEKTRNQAMLDALSQLQGILAAVKSDRMDGGSAIAAAAQIREQYVTSMSALKDAKTRRIALADVSRLDALIGQIRGESDLQLKRQEIDKKLVPEFSTGIDRGLVPYFGGTQTLIKVRPQERIDDVGLKRSFIVPGVDRGIDSVLTHATPGSRVLTKIQQERIPEFATGIDRGLVPYFGGTQTLIKVRPQERIDDVGLMRSFTVPGVDRGIDSVLTHATPGSRVLTKTQQPRIPAFANGTPSALPRAEGRSEPIQVDVYISPVLGVDQETSVGIVRKAAKSSDGREVFINVHTDARQRGKGMFN
jgi:hypothetical protein